MSPNINFRITFIHLFNFVLKTLLKLQQSDHCCADAAANHLYHRCADAAFPDGYIIIPSLKGLLGFIHIFMKTVSKIIYATTFMRKYKVEVYNKCAILYAV